jgi:hypothetical protein
MTKAHSFILLFFLFLFSAVCAAEDTGEKSGFELSLLRRRNSELEKTVSEQKQEILRLQQLVTEMQSQHKRTMLWLGTISDTGEMLSASERELLLAERLSVFVRKGEDLALCATQLADDIRIMLDEVPMSAVRKAKISLQLKKIDDLCSSFVGAAAQGGRDPLESLQNTRIITVDRGLDVVILSAGSLDGVAPGIVFQNKDNSIALRVIAVKEYASAAVVSKGKISEINRSSIFSPVSGGTTSTLITAPGVEAKSSD